MTFNDAKNDFIKFAIAGFVGWIGINSQKGVDIGEALTKTVIKHDEQISSLNEFRDRQRDFNQQVRQKIENNQIVLAKLSVKVFNQSLEL